MKDLARLRRSLLFWFAREKRPLPWRLNREAYPVWVSEMMLQQTTVAAVIPYYHRFLARFPTVASLASADEDAVLALWSGLGYYSRARNLRLAAQRLMAAHNGAFPKDVKTAMTLPGVGRYTARAVTSIAYGVQAAVVDGNVRRVLSRLFALRSPRESEVQALADRLLSKKSPGTWNEAMMELGATVCPPTKPRCDMCPLSSGCLGKERPEYWSEGKPRRATVNTPVEMGLVERRGRILLIRNPVDDLMGGLYELPHAGLPRRNGSVIGLAERYRGSFRLETHKPLAATFRHAITHHRIEATVIRAKLLGRSTPEGAAFHSVSEAFRLPLGGLTRKALRALGHVP